MYLPNIQFAYLILYYQRVGVDSLYVRMVLTCNAKLYNFTTNTYLSTKMSSLSAFYDQQDSFKWPKAMQKTAKCKSVRS